MLAVLDLAFLVTLLHCPSLVSGRLKADAVTAKIIKKVDIDTLQTILEMPLTDMINSDDLK